MIVFGTGVLYGVPNTDQTGTAVANPTPVQFGVLQECAADLSFDSKYLYGAYQMPQYFGRGKGKFDFKAKFADFSAQALAGLFFGNSASLVTALRAVVDNEVHAAATTVTIAPPGSGVFATDLGVRYQSTGIGFTRVASAPPVGSYSVVPATGVYTFNASESGNLLISYEYTGTSTTQFQVPFSNQLMGQAPSFLAELHLPYSGKQLTIKLNNCISSKFTNPFKNEDFSVSEFDFTALADASNNIGTYSFA